ncbi:hypothetical protein KGQ27_03315 [Patescibacteria group bacterium]|nr:hypothetical protein [Patescibacteria group bacterium]MDE1946711.1 hypothetical protein [Patescibacteria group bacterium]MDE2010986.1 hypothetical protein [Patescibacteria group bacterium]MDE2232828.1 hypothetical protein [Patescibacteria group bacterium]
MKDKLLKTKYFFTISAAVISFAVFAPNISSAQTAAGDPAMPPIILEISSSRTLSGTAGDFVEVHGDIKNAASKPITDVTAYLSLVDTKTHMPVDLEDWSVEKGLFVGTIGGAATLPLDWKIHFVTSGDYALSILAVVKDYDKPIGSAITYFHVAPKQNLNPGAVLPVALGEPIFLAMFFLAFKYRRDKKSA